LLMSTIEKPVGGSSWTVHEGPGSSGPHVSQRLKERLRKSLFQRRVEVEFAESPGSAKHGETVVRAPGVSGDMLIVPYLRGAQFMLCRFQGGLEGGEHFCRSRILDNAVARVP